VVKGPSSKNIITANLLLSKLEIQLGILISTGRRYLDMDEYFQWRVDQSDGQTLSEEASLNGKRAAQPTAVPA